MKSSGELPHNTEKRISKGNVVFIRKLSIPENIVKSDCTLIYNKPKLRITET
jgi:hypothetical protein